MEFNQLRYFQVVARCESITKAAEELHITQSALSKVIGRLETELGCQLFERQKRRMRLNANGMQLLHFTTATFESLSSLMNNLTDESQSSIRIVYTNSGYIDKQLELCTAKFPDILVETRELQPDECFCELENHQSNMAVLPMPTDISVGWEPLYLERWCVIFHRLRDIGVQSGAATIKQIAQQPIVYCGDSGTYRFLLRAFERHGLTPNVILQTETASLAAAEVNRCAAVAIAPYNIYYNLMLSCPDMPIRAARLIDGNLRRSIYIRKTAEYPSGERYEAFYQTVRKEILQHWQRVLAFMERYFVGQGDIPPVH